MVDKGPDGASLRGAWRSLGQRVAVAGGSFVALLSLFHHVPASTAALRGAAAWFGVLVLTRASRRAEVLYDRGDIVAIRLDGEATADLHDVFEWSDGTFRVVARQDVPEVSDEDADTAEWVRPSKVPEGEGEGEDTGRQRLLRVVEVALSSVAFEAAKRRPQTTSLPPQEKTRASTFPPPQASRGKE